MRTRRAAPAATPAVTLGLAAALLGGRTSSPSPADHPVAVTNRPPAPRTSGDSTVQIEVTASQPQVTASLQLVGVNDGLVVPHATLAARPVPLHEQLTFHRGPGAGTLGVAVRQNDGAYNAITCTITVDGHMVLRDSDTNRCTYSEDPTWQYLLEKGIP